MDPIHLIDDARIAHSEYIDKLAKISEFFEPGEVIDEIKETEIFENSRTSATFEERNLLSTLESQVINRYYFDHLEEDIFDFLYQERETKTYRYHHREKPVIFGKLAEQACFGDVEKCETLIDENVRKGRDIPTEKLRFDPSLITSLTSLFKKNFRVNNIRVIPYKVNYYGHGDFFLPHRDHPEPNLISTIIFHVEGDTKAFSIDGVQWDARQNNVCMFFTDVLHEVKPVDNHRETITFKVYTTFDTGLCENLSPIERGIIGRVPTNTFGIVLQNGYTMKDDNYKGVDKEIYDILIKLGRTFSTVPIVVTETTRFDEDSEKFYDAYDEDCYLTCVGEDPISVKGSLKYEEIVEWTSQIHGVHLEVWNMKNYPNPVKPMNVYYLGKGFKIGERATHNLHIGNQSSGTLVDNVYLNKMFVVE